jgi:iron-only hydrogenase group A
MLFNIEINGRQVSAKKGETILSVINRVGIKVPTLCYLSSLSLAGACRMCVVEVEGLSHLVPACSHPVEEWMQIHTHSPRVLNARKAILELLLANHPDDCLYCDRNGSCELQALSDELQVRERKYIEKRRHIQIDKACPSIERDPAKCVLCGRCSRICTEVIGVSAIGSVGRGSNSRIGTSYNKGLNFNACVKCGQCIMICPTGALTERKSLNKVMEALATEDLYTVVQFSPTVPAAIAEEFGLKTNKDILNLMRAAFKKMGFRQSFDVSLAADLTIMEEAAAFLDRVNANEKLPMLTGCCPAWVKYLEVNKPHLLSNLSGTKSPQQIMGTVIKKYITSSAGLKPEKVFIVSVMPCTAKKAEPESDQTGNNGLQLLDAVITTRELFKMIRLMGIDFTNLEPEPADTAFSLASSAGRLFGVSGGHLEGLLRTIHFMSSGQELNPFKINELRGLKSKKEARMRINRQAYTVVAVNGLANAIQLLGEIEAGKTDYKIVEVMACPFGCINGGGQKIGSDEKSLKARMKALYDVDEEEMLKVAHKNPVITDFYDKFLSKPNSERNRDLLHHNRTKTPDA